MEDKRPEFDAAVEHLKMEYAKLRTNRANPALVEGVKVDFYGKMMQIKELGSVSVPEATQLLIQPWDKNALQPIEDAIRKSDLGLNPTNEGDKLRITLPELTQERREELAKLAGKIAEEARVRVRNLREGIWKDVQKQEDIGEITEDDKFQKKEELQKMVDGYNGNIKDIQEAKEQEIKNV